MEEILDGTPFREKLGIRHVADVAEPAGLERRAHLLAGADGHRALHDQDRAALQPRQLVDHCPHTREIGITRVGRRRVDADEHELRGGGGLRCVKRERQPVGIPLHQVFQLGLEEWHLTGP